MSARLGAREWGQRLGTAVAGAVLDATVEALPRWQLAVAVVVLVVVFGVVALESMGGTRRSGSGQRRRRRGRSLCA